MFLFYALEMHEKNFILYSLVFYNAKYIYAQMFIN